MTSNSKYDKVLPNPIAVLQTILEHVSEEEAGETDDGPFTAADERWAQALHQTMMARVAVMRRQLTPFCPPIKTPSPIRSDLRFLHREEVLARIAVLVESGAVQYAHQDLTKLSDEDLRWLLADLSPTTVD
jgi:hypothetical protein